MNILVLGGTGFLGRIFVEIAQGRGHRLTLFNRGKRNPGLFPEVEQIHGDRGIDLSLLDGRDWDAVFDTSGYFPRVVGMSANLLKDRARSYLFVSSVSAYKDFDIPDQNEDGELATLEDGPVEEEITGATYGPLKVLCEQAVQEAFGDRAIVVRPGLIVGPYDNSDRFTYWPARMTRGGDVLVPNFKDQPVQIIDVRDLAEWCLRLFEDQVSGVFNATAPAKPYRFEEVMAACVAGTSARLVWVDGPFLEKNKIEPWSDLPLLVGYDGSGVGLNQMDISRALATGLQLRPLEEIVSDAREWAASRPADHSWKAGLSPDREASLLTSWRQNAVL
jgi:2'-hydroxyisoflavone reductase